MPKHKSGYTGAQAYRRKDGKYGWRMIENDVIQGVSAPLYDSIEDAMDGLINMITYTIEQMDEQRRASLNADGDMLDATLPHEVPRSSVCHWCRKGECNETHGKCINKTKESK